MSNMAKKLGHPGGWVCRGQSGCKAGLEPASVEACLEAKAMGTGLMLGCQGPGAMGADQVLG